MAHDTDDDDDEPQQKAKQPATMVGVFTSFIHSLVSVAVKHTIESIALK